jgi:hypothetical protein
MRNRFNIAVLMFIALTLVMTADAQAKKPGGPPPAEESVCDPLKGKTPGLFGLCVAFCEAHECQPDFSAEDPFAECRPGSLQVLENYREKMRPGDPDMPCLQGSCPCWNPEQLAALRFPLPDDEIFCNQDAHVGSSEISFYDQFNFYGSVDSLDYYLKLEALRHGENATCLLYDGCWADDDSCGTNVFYFEITADEHATCVDLLKGAASARGIPCFDCDR